MRNVLKSLVLLLKSWVLEKLFAKLWFYKILVDWHREAAAAAAAGICSVCCICGKFIMKYCLSFENYDISTVRVINTHLSHERDVYL